MIIKNLINHIIYGAILGLNIMYLVVKERIQNRVASFKHIESKLMLTKGHPPKIFMNYVAHMSLVASFSVLD